MPLVRGDYESAPKWIWAADDNALTKATPGKHDFRFTFKLAQKPKEATLFITAKDNVAAWVNGKQVVVESPMGKFGRAQDPWGYFRVIPVGKLLSAGANSLAAEAIVQQERNRPPQAGFIALLRVQMADGKIERLVSGPEWKTAPGADGQCLGGAERLTIHPGPPRPWWRKSARRRWALPGRRNRSICCARISAWPRRCAARESTRPHSEPISSI